MASNTEHLGLLMKDPVVDGNDSFNVETMLNENWRRIDEGLGPLSAVQAALVRLAPAHVYMQHWWKRRKAAQTFEPKVDEAINLSSIDDQTATTCIVHIAYAASQTVTIQYADSVAHDTDGSVVLVDPQKAEVTVEGMPTGGSGFETDYDFLKGKYVKNNNGYVLYIPVDATFDERRHSSYPWACWSNYVCRVWANVPARTWEQVHSENSETYPANGVEGIWEYHYMGIPMERLPNCGNVASGSYIGTGTGGPETPNALEFAFTPQLIIITAEPSAHAISPYTFVRPLEGSTRYYDGNSASVSYYTRVTWTNNGMRWYAKYVNGNPGSAAAQMNTYGMRYYYVAIG